MTDAAIRAPTSPRLGVEALYGLAVFSGAALIFLLEPMVGRLLTPLLGGSPAVWNTSLAFFQIALLGGYFYAHLLQKLGSTRRQAAVHLVVLVLAGLALPLHVSGLFGPPPPEAPVAWLLGVLAVSVGAPFAALSATAPLLQAWFARERTAEPYRLYAASNLGSLLALAAYSTLVEPFAGLGVQTLAWSLAYGGFALLVAALAMTLSGARPAAAREAAPARVVPAASSWRERAAWLALSALPSSLMMGATSHILTDIASAPFLWVAPLALYLLTFVLAFSARPVLGADRARLWQAAGVCLLTVSAAFALGGWPLQLGLHLGAFFLTALVCHQALAARRPEPARLTDFYLTMSVGGVIGGGFNAFLAPVLFPQVWEYPLALALAGLARPWGGRRPSRGEAALLALGLAAAALAAPLAAQMTGAALLALAVAAAAAFLLRDRGPAFALLTGAALVSGLVIAAGGARSVETRRSFFGVSRVAEAELDGLGKVRLLYHGTTLHGAEAAQGPGRCRPMTYYAPETPIGAAFARAARSPRPLAVGAIGLGAGAVAAYTRPGDRLRFFEIDPAVEAIARSRFDYVGACAGGGVDYRLGDARLTLAREPAGGFDLLLVDAFSSDSVPTHLMTVEAMRLYLDKVKPEGGVVLLHLTNRNLALVQPAAAVARAAGAEALVQRFDPGPGKAPAVTRSTVMAVSRDPRALAGFRADPRWRPADPQGQRAWTDDYVNVAGALARHLMGAR